MSRKKIRIVNKKRFIIFLVAVFLTITLAFNGLTNLSLAYGYEQGNYAEMTIIHGDTLWEIAKRNNPYNEDIRKIVHKIMEINDMKSANLKVGSVIKIPKY